MQAKSAITIADKYVLVRKLATDATTELFLARKNDVGGGVQVVVRRLIGELAHRKDLQDMFGSEARTAAVLEHPNILKVIEVGPSGSDPFIAMEFIQGHPLSRVQAVQAERGSGIPPQFGLVVILDAARGLFYAHERQDAQGKPLGILHRFLSPAKIVVGYDGISRVTDFGVTRPWFRVNEGDVGDALTRVRYLSPEQVKGQKVGPASDIYSLGVILYELTTGRPPFNGDTPQEVTRAIIEGNPASPRGFVPGYPEEMESLVLQAMAPDPEKRFPNAAALAAALEVFLVRHEIPSSAQNVAGYIRTLFGGGAPVMAPVQPPPVAAASQLPLGELDLGEAVTIPVDAFDSLDTLDTLDVGSLSKTVPGLPPGLVPNGAQELILDFGDTLTSETLDLQEITGSNLSAVDTMPATVVVPAPSAQKKGAPPPPPPPSPKKAAGVALPPIPPPGPLPPLPPVPIPDAPPVVAAAPPPPPPPPPVPSGPTPEELQLRERVTNLAKENALLRQEVLPLREELGTLRPEYAARKAELEALGVEKGKLEAQVSTLTGELGATRTELATIRADVAAAQGATAAMATTSGQKLDAAKAREEDARRELAATSERESKTRRDLEVYKARDGAMRKEFNALKSREAQAKSEIEVLTAREVVFEKNAAEMQKALELARRAAQSALRDAAAARQEVEAARKASEARDQANARQLEAVKRESQAKLEAGLASGEAAQKRLSEEARAEASKAKAEASAARGALDDAKQAADKARLETGRVRAELEDTRAEIAVAHQALQAVLEENAAKAAAEAESGKKAATASEDAQSARREAQVAKAEADAARAEAEKALKAAAAARTEAEAALQEVQAAKEQRARAETAAEEAEQRRLKLEMAEEEVAAARKGEVAAAMQVVRTAMQEADAARAEAEQAKVSAEAAREESEAAKQDAAAAHQRAEEARQEAEKARQLAETTRATAEKMRAEAAEAKKLAEKAMREAETTLQEADEKKADATRKLEEEREAKKRREVEQKEVEGAQMQVLATAMRSIEIAKQEADEALQAAVAAKTEAEVSRKEAETAKALAEKARKEADQARKEGEAARREAEASRREAEVLRREAEGVKREADVLRGAAETAKRDAAAAEAARAAAAAEEARAAEAARKQAAATAAAAKAAAEAKTARPAARRAEDAAAKPGESALRRYQSSAAPSAHSNLIAIPGAFVGRAEALRALEPLVLGDIPQVTLMGAAGSGRTRLARRFASQHLAELSKGGGVWFVDLSAAEDAEGICGATAAALGLVMTARDATTATEQIAGVLASRGRMLLILDGADAVAPDLCRVIDAWRAVASDLRVLVVAEAPIGLENEGVLEAGALAVPPPDGALDSEAGRLFVARARERHREGDPPPPAADPDVCGIVRVLQGGPLAIELIAARSDDFTIAALRADLEETLGSEELPPTEVLTRVLAWSWDRLATWEQDALSQASIFASEFTAEAASAVIDLAAHPDAPPAGDVLRALVAAALLRVRAATDARDQERFEMHPAVRAFAAERLGDPAAVMARHTAWALRAGRALAASLEGPSAAAAFRRLELFHRDLESILVRTLEGEREKEQADIALDTARILEPIWVRRATIGRGITLAGKAIELGTDLATPLPLGEARMVRGRLRRIARKLSESDLDLQAARVIAAAAEDRRFEARVLAEIGLTLLARGQGELARHSLDQALDIARRLSDVRLQATFLGYLGTVSREMGRVELTRNCFEQAAALCVTLADRRLEAEMLERAGAAAREMGARDDARKQLERALSLSAAVQDRGFDGRVLAVLADLALEDGRNEESRELYKASFEPLSAAGLRREEAVARGNLGVLEHLDGRLDEAKARFATASRLLDEAGEGALDGLYLAHLAALEAAKGATENATAVFETARRRIKDSGGGAAVLSAADTLTAFLDLARAKKTGDAKVRKTHRDAALKKVPPTPHGSAARIAAMLVQKAAAGAPTGS